MDRRLTKETFLERAKWYHGDKYDYSKVVYVNNSTKVCIICPEHGEFWQRAQSHMHGCGCPKCISHPRGKLIFGVATNDISENTNCACYMHWYLMLSRCYYDKALRLNPSYSDVRVCDEWLTYSNFKKWFDEHYVEGWQLDKDILVKGNKVYSPDTCCFVPKQINSLFIRHKKKKDSLPIGVSKRGKKYVSMLSMKYLGRFDTPEEAFDAYKMAKEAHIKEMADKWKDKLDPKVYNTLYNWEMELIY